MHQIKLVLINLVIVVSSLWELKPVTSQDFNYIPGDPRGPERWGYLKEEWATCRTGQRQSPINLPFVPLYKTPRGLNTRYVSSNATVLNRGYEISLQWRNNSAGAIEINGTDYFLQNAHWHSPSEHTIHGTRFDLELHLVHTNPNATLNTSVVAYLYKFGSPDPFIERVLKFENQLNNTRQEIGIGMVDPNEIRTGGRSYYRYMGSLTTPPCREGVIWSVFTKLSSVSREQVRRLQGLLNAGSMMNARPLQPRNNRTIQLFIPRPYA